MTTHWLKRLLLAVALLQAPVLVSVLTCATRAHAAEESGPVDEDALKKDWNISGPKGDLFHDVASSLRCPTCTGLSVLQSDARFSQQIKEIVWEQVNQGKTRDQILQYFTQRYGTWILREPPAKGFNMLAWALPLGLLLIGPLAVWFFVWRKRKVVTTMGVRPAEDIIREFDAHLARLRGT